LSKYLRKGKKQPHISVRLGEYEQ
jgi:hypothetical protein